MICVPFMTERCRDRILCQAADRLGRLLFIFTWHQEVVAARYGPAETESMRAAISAALAKLHGTLLRRQRRHQR